MVKFSTKFCISNSGVGNVLTARNYSTLPCGNSTHQCSVENFQPDPWWVTGFVDGEGCFHVSVTQNKNYKLGWRPRQHFLITQHVRDRALLERIRNVLGVGKIFRNSPQTLQLKVESLKELEAVINHFDQFPLFTQKRSDFRFFRKVYWKVKLKEHLTPEGFIKIVAIKAAMNRGLSDELRAAFPGIVPAVRPLVENPQKQIIDPNWLAGFTSAEGCFYINIFKSKSSKIGDAVKLEFQLTQHSREEDLMKNLIKLFHCGGIYKNRDAFYFRVIKFSDITDKIIPFFKKYKIRGVKALDFMDWCQAAEMMNNKEHFTPEGLDKIKKIKAGMNKGRKF